MNADSGSVLDVDGVTVRFGGLTALDGVSFGVAPRQVLGLIGPNGAGKTTLLNVLCGFIRPNEGRVRFAGRELTRLPPHRLAGLGVARTLQGVGLFAGLTAVENVMVGANCRASAGFWPALAGLPRSGRDERRLRAEALEALRQTGAAAAADRKPGELPYGVRKRVALARALAARPRLLLLDEPASGLADDELAGLADLVTQIAAQAALVVVEHHMDWMMSVCDSLVVLDFGKVIASGSPKDVQADPAVTAAYLGADGEAAETGTGDGAAQNATGERAAVNGAGDGARDNDE
ncbi:MAG: ABC transporter ATP-binding protein [Streptosporangiaceae bacterium]|nr:ABC transporter ATP-binding protein [Streptosporangiaceae bacterium]MBV9853817.1 ABC transporter ATP-binding protein [Streptosporangiaceae bacterium]